MFIIIRGEDEIVIINILMIVFSHIVLHFSTNVDHVLIHLSFSMHYPEVDIL